jgi:antitoxin component YwqK of YwqJK toxin-antitoxin module
MTISRKLAAAGLFCAFGLLSFAQEKKRDYYENGNLKAEYQYDSNGLLTGEMKLYYENGKIESLQNWQKDYWNGFSIWYYPNGNIEESGNFNYQCRSGLWKFYDEKTGKLIEEGHYEEPAGNLICEVNVESSKVGTWKYYAYYDSGIIHKIATNDFDASEYRGSLTVFHEDGDIREKAVLIKKDGSYFLEEYTTIYPSGNKEKILEWQDSNVYIQRSFYETGELQSVGTLILTSFSHIPGIFESDLKEYNSLNPQGLMNGTWQFYHKNEKPLATGAYKDSQKIKQWNFYFENGQKQCEGRYENDLMSGQWQFYHENGKLKSTGNFLVGEKIGKWTFYDEIGNLTKTSQY